MLIAHLSDTHLGAVPYSKSEREEDFYNALKQAIDIMIKDHVKVVIHAGDIFDIPRPSGTAINRLLEMLKELKKHDVKFLFILGEHDISRVRSTPVPLLYTKVDLATYIDNTHKDNKVKIGDITIVGYNKHRSNEIEELKKNLSNLNVEGKKILVLHQGIKSFYEYGELSHLDLPKDFNYYAMGHIHNRMEKYLDGFKGPICYPGSTEVTRFTSDENLEKGFYIVDLSREEANVEWIKLDIREHKVIRIDNDLDIDSKLNELKASRSKPVLKVIFNDVDMEKSRYILRRLEEYSLHILVEYNYNTKSNLLLFDNGQNVTSLEDIKLRYAEHILGSREKAEFALNELLKAILEDKNEAKELLWQVYKSRRFE